MASLTIGNSYSKLSGLTPKQEKEVRALLSYTVDAKSSYFSGGYGPRKKCLMDKKGNFPTGLIYRLPMLGMKIVDTRVKPASMPQPFVLKGAPYPWQIAAVKAAQESNRGIITAPTGTGKSMAMALLITRLNVKTLIVVPSLEIKKQLMQTIDLPNVRIENIDSTALETLTDFDCLIIDEAHHVAAKTYQRLNKLVWNKIYYRFFFTATPFRNDVEENMLFEAIAGEVIYKLNYRDAISNGYIVPLEAYYIEIPKQTTDAYTYREVYSELVVNHETRNLYIAKILLNLEKSSIHSLCLVREVNHGNILSEFTGSPFVSGADDESRSYIQQFNSGNIKTLIGTTGILGEGVDTRPAEYCIIAGLGKAKSQFMQQIGRVLRNYPGKTSGKIIIFKDRSHKFLLRHFREQCKILRDEYGVEPIKLEIE